MQYFYPPNERILLIFNVREEALFHDGTPVLAEDVKYTVDRMLALKIEIWAYLTPVSGAEVLDERRVAIDLSVPFAGLLGAMTRLYIANADLIRANEFQGDFRQRWLQNHEAGSGPYRLVSFQPEQQFTVERFPDYHLGWGSRHVERAVFRDSARPIPKGYEVQLSDVRIQVTAVTTDGQPKKVVFTCEKELKDESLRWVRYEDGRYVPFELPMVGQTIALDAVPFDLLSPPTAKPSQADLTSPASVAASQRR